MPLCFVGRTRLRYKTWWSLRKESLVKLAVVVSLKITWCAPLIP